MDFFASLWVPANASFAVRHSECAETDELNAVLFLDVFAFLFLASYLIRTFVSIYGFYLVGSGDYKCLLFCLIAFMSGRIVVTYWTGPSKENAAVNGGG